jgi:hypothetical protein
MIHGLKVTDMHILLTICHYYISIPNQSLGKFAFLEFSTFMIFIIYHVIAVILFVVGNLEVDI